MVKNNSAAPPAMLKNIQALRAAAALLVVAAHLGGLARTYPYLTGYDFPQGVFGVDLFFVISGFIMAMVTRDCWARPGAFLTARALRIYPLYWICALIATPAFVAFQLAFRGEAVDTWSYQIKSFLLWPALTSSGELYPALDVGWTLIYEMLFYAVMAALMLLPRSVFVPMLALTLTGLYFLGAALPGGAWGSLLSNPIYFEFLLGVLVAEIMHRGWLTAPTVAGLCLAGLWLYEPAFNGWQRVIHHGAPAASLVAAAIWIEERGFAAPRLLRFLGDASYSIYLTHPLTLWRLGRAMKHIAPVTGPVAAIWIVGVAAVAVACLTYWVVERPLHKMAKALSGLLRRRQRADDFAERP